ncbi:MAG: imidazole glycerol phosphate synthase subunit HisH [Microgenomates group bacterium]
MIVIIDYGMGNVGSVQNALDRLGAASIITDKQEDIQNANGIILPGVGSAGAGMKNIKERGLDAILANEIRKGKPFLGICLGMQLLMEKSMEGDVLCLGYIPGIVTKFKGGMKIPQIGWNTVKTKGRGLFNGLASGGYFYFVHSYYCMPKDRNIVTGITNYGGEFCSAFQMDNIYGVQFHPEKSGRTGEIVLQNFIEKINENNTGN